MKYDKPIAYQNHLEISDGETKIVSNALCPLTTADIVPEQLLDDGEHDVIICCCAGQEPIHTDFVCPHFFGATYPFKNSLVDCRCPKLKIYFSDDKH
jgi:hypothetical protein